MTYDSENGWQGTLNKTWQQIRDAMESKICMLVATDGDNADSKIIESVYDDPESMEGRYQVATDGAFFTTDSKDGYPAIGGLG